MRLGRFPANAEAKCMLGPFNENVTLEIVSMSMVDENTPGSRCWLAYDKESCRRSLGYPLEPGTEVEVDLIAGQELWCVATSTALVGYSVKSWRGK